jgi:hypothetical protein
MIGAEVVYGTHQIHGVVQRGHLSCQRTPATNQRRDPRAEGGIQSLNVSRVDDAASLRLLQQGIDLSTGSLHDAAGYSHHALAGIVLDKLSDQDAIPWSQARTGGSAGAYGLSENALDGLDVGLASIDAEQKRPTESTGPHLGYQSEHQAPVSVGTDHPSQPQPGIDLNGHCHPQYPALDLGADLVCLHLPQIAWLLYQMLVNILTLFPAPPLPTQYRALIQTKGHDDRLNRAAVGQQGHDYDDQILRRPQAVERSPFGLGKGLVALVASVAMVFLAMHTNVSFANLSPCRTSEIRAKYSLWVQRHSPGLILRSNRIVLKDPILSIRLPTTV